MSLSATAPRNLLLLMTVLATPAALAAQTSDGGAGAAHHFIYFSKDRRLFGHTHQQLVFQTAGQQCMENWVASVCYQVNLNDRLLSRDVHCFRQIHKWPFR